MESAKTRIGLDGLFLSQPHTGSGQYTLHLWRHLAVAGGEPESVLLRPQSSADAAAESMPGQEIRLSEPGYLRAAKARKLWWEQYGVLKAARQAGVDLLHVPYFSAPRVARLRAITTIHDVIPLVFPEYGGSASMRLYLRLVGSATRRLGMILTDSECSRIDIERFLGIPRSRIRVIPLAVDERFRPNDDPEMEARLRQRFGLSGPVIFNVGGLDARKNLASLVEAFAQTLPSVDAATRLVIAGRAHTGNPRLYPPLEPVIRRLGLDGKVVLTGPLSESEKLAFYNLSDLYVFPSLYEGFGLSPLEAMACGLPVISSNRSSLPEVVGSGGLLVEPEPGKLAAAMVSVLRNDYERRDLAHRALDQAARFSWRRTAEMTRAAYLDALKTSPARVSTEVRP